MVDLKEKFKQLPELNCRVLSVKFLRGNRSNRISMRYIYVRYMIHRYVDRNQEIYYKELVHVIREANNSQGLLLVRWNPRRAYEVILIQICKSVNQEN